MATVRAGFVDMAERLGGIEGILVDFGARVDQLEETEDSVSSQSAQQWAAQAAYNQRIQGNAAALQRHVNAWVQKYNGEMEALTTSVQMCHMEVVHA